MDAKLARELTLERIDMQKNTAELEALRLADEAKRAAEYWEKEIVNVFSAKWRPSIEKAITAGQFETMVHIQNRFPFEKDEFPFVVEAMYKYLTEKGYSIDEGTHMESPENFTQLKREAAGSKFDYYAFKISW